MPRPLLCPICKSAVVQELDRTGDAIGYDCATHGNFKVADTVFAEAKVKDYTREQWEAALDKANFFSGRMGQSMRLIYVRPAICFSWRRADATVAEQRTLDAMRHHAG